MCAQPSESGFLIGEENCLVLNVLTRNATGPRPVAVFLRGERYTNANYNGLYFERFVVEQGLIIVTINYRLSIFGFLCLGTESAPGNAGLKDVVAALRWIRDNIAGFGGDPNNVMLFGHGSGGAMVDLITLSPLARGLFHKAIAQSGTSLAPWAVSYNPIQMAHTLGQRLDYGGKSNEELAQALATSDITILVNALNDFDVFPNNTAPFAPCLENKNLPGPFMTDSPIDVIRSRNYSQVPFIAGYTNREGSIRAHQALHSGWLERMNDNFTDFIQVDLDFSEASNSSSIIESIRNFYFRSSNVSLQTINDYLAYHGDTMVLVSTIRNVRERAMTSTEPVRLYEFAFIGSWSEVWPYPSIPIIGARHGQELVYLFSNSTDSSVSTENRVRNSLVGRWSAFARTG